MLATTSINLAPEKAGNRGDCGGKRGLQVAVGIKRLGLVSSPHLVSQKPQGFLRTRAY